MVSDKILEALAVTAEVCDRPMSPAAAMVMADDLSKFNESHVLGALKRCRLELTGKLTTAAIIQRLDDGRPTADEAWAMYPHDEDSSAILNNEISESMQDARHLLEEDRVAARMAFKDTYNKRIQESRQNGIAPVWFASLGIDRAARNDAILDGIAKGRLTREQGQAMLPQEFHPKVLELIRTAIR